MRTDLAVSSMEKRRVIHITPYPPELSGIADVTRNLIAAGRERWHCTVLASVALEPARVEPDVIRIWHRNDLRYPLQIARALRNLRGEPSSVAHVQHHFLLYGPVVTAVEFPLLTLAIRLLGYHLVIHLHSVIEPENLGPELAKLGGRAPRHLSVAILRAFYGFICAMSAKVIVSVPTMKDTLHRRYKVPHAKIAVIPFGWDGPGTRTSVSTKDALGFRDKFVIAFHGFLDPTKGLEVLIEAFSLVHGKVPNATLLVLGAASPHLGPDHSEYPESLRRLSAQLGVEDKVLFTGRVEEDLLGMYLRAADMFVLPYTVISSTGASAVLSRIAAYGRPLIASRIPRFSDELVDGETALLVIPGDAARLARAIENLTTQPDLAERLGRALGEVATGRTWERAAELVDNVYSELEASQ